MRRARLRRKVLEIFVTSADDPIYAIKSNVPPEVFGAFGSYFSRNPLDLREHLWRAISGQVQGEETDPGEQGLEWLLATDLREPANAIRDGLAKAQDFFKRWYGRYSHKSIANVVWIPMVGTNVSQLFARELAYDQLAFFIEQSTRFFKFDTRNMHLDREVMNSPHAETFISGLTALTSAYEKLTPELAGYNTLELPFKKWLDQQPEDIKNSPKPQQKRKYTREMVGKTLDVTRYLLPQATQTNIAWILDARSTESNIAAWKEHPLQEMRIAAGLIEKHAGQIAPSLLKYTEPNQYDGDRLHDFEETNGDDQFVIADAKQLPKDVKIISHDPDSLNKTVAHMFRRHGRGGSFLNVYDTVKKMPFDKKIDFLRRATRDRTKHDEWIGVDQEFDCCPVTIEFQTDLGAVRDWRRHQKWNRVEGRATLDNGHTRPEDIDALGSKAIKIYEDAITAAHKAEQALQKDFPHQAQYPVPMAANHSITMSAGLDQTQYMLWTRTTPQANPSYRKDAFNLAEAIARTHPWMLGYKTYPKGKPFLKVYAEAPLKNLMPLQTDPDALHQ